MNNYRFNIFTIITSVMFVFFVAFALWPNCLGNVCVSLLWGQNPQNDFDSLLLFSPIFLVIFFAGIFGLIKYALGYGMGKFGHASDYSKNATKDRKNELLYSSLLTTLYGVILLSILIWDLIILRRMM